MTVREKLLADLFNNGLFQEQAEAVLQHYMESDLGKEMRNRLDDQVSDYPDVLWGPVWMGVKLSAIEWIDKNCPKHWARAVFVGF